MCSLFALNALEFVFVVTATDLFYTGRLRYNDTRYDTGELIIDRSCIREDLLYKGCSVSRNGG